MEKAGLGTGAEQKDLCFACKYAQEHPDSGAKECVMRRSGFEACSGSLADLASCEKLLDVIEEMLSVNEEHDRLLDVKDIEPDPDNEFFGGKRARMTLLTKTGRKFTITVEMALCRRCRVPALISDEHDRDCTWHPSKRVAL